MATLPGPANSERGTSPLGQGASERFDLAVVGAGIVGLGCALAAARRGKRVVVIDRDAQANGASVRNFGFITVTGQAAGQMWSLARRSALLWAELADQASIPVLHRGMALAVRRPESVAVLEAFLKTDMADGCELLGPAQLATARPELAGAGHLAALKSPHELRVESRQAIPRMAEWLEQAHGVTFRRLTTVLGVETGKVLTTAGVIEADAIVVCPGDDLTSLFPDRLAANGVTRCKLQMLRLASPGFTLAGGVMSDLGLVRYSGYADLPEAAALKARLEKEQAGHLANGVHLIVVQSADGSLVVGDSHHYGATPDPFSHQGVDDLILDEYAAVFGGRAPPVVERWVGTYAYAKACDVVIDDPAPGVRLVTVTTGAGASVGLALGEDVISDLL
ncbi:MAG: TIGR03364 family FAD-dependent oxidoreductase [Alphaproteobacteria bacterium PA2]|nr:MAG: TIGR03364 family FAD-dependent oxidoreductase [Alphaproteobacteria bacterium PA2]